MNGPESYNAALQDQLRDLTRRALEEIVLGFEVLSTARSSSHEGAEEVLTITVRWGHRPTNEARAKARQEPSKNQFYD